MNNLKLFTLAAFSILLTFNAQSQDSNPTKSTTVTEQQPEFPGSFSDYIKDNLKYPEVAKTAGLTGKVIVQFIIDEKGNVVEVEPLKTLGGGCTEEAVRVVSSSPKWKPGIQKGVAVRVKYVVPVNFSNNIYREIELQNLQKSDYGFLFFLEGNIKTIDEARRTFGNSYSPVIVANVEENKDPKYAMPDKKAVYIIYTKPPTVSDLSKSPGNNVFTAIEVEPQFNGDFGTFLRSQIKYPEVDKLLGITGKVFVQFMLKKMAHLQILKF